MSNSITDKEFKQLDKSIDWTIKQLEEPKRNRVSAVKQYVGRHYTSNGDGTSKRMPTNFLYLATGIYVRQLAPHSPRVLVTTPISSLKPYAKNAELAVNEVPAEINLDTSFSRWVMEAIFSMGILKVGLSTVDNVMGHPYGKPFVDVVTMDDYFCDASAESRDQIQYEGNDYWMNYEDVMEADWIDGDVKESLRPDDYTTIGIDGTERADKLSNGESAELYKEKIKIRDVWITEDRILLTYAVTAKKIMRQVKWKGPNHSPYYILGYSDVPGNLLPLAPVAIWRDLNELGNDIFRKVARQAEAEKSVAAFSNSDDEAINSFIKASDGEGIKYTGNEPRTLTAGGVNPTSLAFFLQVKDVFSYFAGNIDSVGGLSQLTETVGQDRLLSAAANASMRDMAEKTTKGMKEIFEALLFYEWSDPTSRRTLEKKIPGVEMSIPVIWNHSQKQGNISAYQIKVDVYSLQDQSPDIKLQKLGLIMEQYILPLVPLIQQDGGSIDSRKILSIVARYSDMEAEIGDIVQYTDREPINSMGAEGGSTQSNNTTRTYDRVTKGGKQDGGSGQLQQAVADQAAKQTQAN